MFEFNFELISASFCIFCGFFDVMVFAIFDEKLILTLGHMAFVYRKYFDMVLGI